MYQFYYADEKKNRAESCYKRNVMDEYQIFAIRPTMWEEHCLECSAPACFNNCIHYIARKDGRCKRFENGILVKSNERGCGGQSARIQFRKWANMMTIIFPGMITYENYIQLIEKNQRLGKHIRKIVDSPLPATPKFSCIRVPEYLRRRRLRKMDGKENVPTAFIFHGYSFEKYTYQFVVEVFDDSASVFKTSLTISPGENLYILESDQLNPACWHPDYLVKVYPENNLEAELEILWCDFVQGKKKDADLPASKVKCLVWDLDNTLWDGILIETDNPDNLSLREGVFDLIKALDAKGILQSIASKNNFEAAWPVLQKMGIDEYFLYPQIHWEAKSYSMGQIARQLNIGIDSLALIDDSPFERNQVNFVWPQVRTYDEKEISVLLSKPEFDVMVTDESRKRREMYKAEEKRNLLKTGSNTDILEFLKKCNLRTAVFEPVETEIGRCFELVVRTNQLNMSGNKYSEEEFERVLKKPDHTNFAFSCEDDFGKYGVVGFGQYRVDNTYLIFTEFAMSCRVAGKYVESALFSFLLKQEQCEKGVFKVNKTKKNTLLRKTLEEIGFSAFEEDEKMVIYHFTTELLHKEVVTIHRRER